MKEFFDDPQTFQLDKGGCPREHSQKIDDRLNLKVIDVESQLLKQKNRNESPVGNAWIGLHPQTLQTPYCEIHEFLRYLMKFNIESLVDLGAGYGRVGVVMNALIPKAQFLGYEIVDERLNAGQRVFKTLQLKNARLEKKDILSDSFDLPTADVYFIYDFSSNISELKKVLKMISAKFIEGNCFLVARGKGVQSLIQLKFPELWRAHGVIYKQGCCIYSSFS